MKLDVRNLRYMTKDDFRALSGVEAGMRNHELVPVELIASLAGLRHGGIAKVLSTLLKFKLIAHDRSLYDGYKLTYSGYDYLALRSMLQRDTISGLGRQIGVGKESDVYLAEDSEGTEMVLKLQRLGRTSFRAIKTKRDYLQHRKSASWLYMSRLGALKEYAFMQALHEAGFPTPTPIDCSRHAVLMSKVDGFPLHQIGHMKHPDKVYAQCMSILIRMAQMGLVHCDFNEFNLMVNEDEVVTMIDFPQMVSTNHANAAELFERDVSGIEKWFANRYAYIAPDDLTLHGVPVPPDLDDIERIGALDSKVAASGFLPHHAKLFSEMSLDSQLIAHGGDLVEADDEEDDGGASDGEQAAAAAGQGEHKEGDAGDAAQAAGGRLLAEGVADDAHDYSHDPLAEGDDEGAASDDDGDGTGTAAAGAAGAARFDRQALPEHLDDQAEAQLGRVPEGVRRRADGRRILPHKSRAVAAAQKHAIAASSAARKAAAGEAPALGLTDAQIRDKVKASLGKKSKKGNKVKGRNTVKNREVSRAKKEAKDAGSGFWG